MSDNDQDFEKLRDQLKSMTGSLGRMTSSIDKSTSANIRADNSREASKKKLEADLSRVNQRVTTFWNDTTNAVDRNTRALGSTFSTLSGDTDRLSDRMRAFAENIPGGTMIGAMAAWSKNTVDSWRGMMDIGQSFNGSMFGLAESAMAAGLPLREFADAVRDNAKAAAVYGVMEVTGTMRRVREMTQANGLLGYTMEGLNKTTGDYLETQRLYGNRGKMNNDRIARNSVDFAKNITAMAAATGQSRDAILAATNAAMRDVAMISRTVGMSSSDVESMSMNLARSATILSGLPGIAGETFGSFLTQSAGYGTALFADATSTFIEGGLGQMVSSMDRLSSTVMNNSGNIEGATWQYVEDFKAQVESNRDALQIQAMAGNAASRQILQMYSEVQHLTEADYRRKRKEAEQSKALTAFIAGVGNAFKMLFTSLLTGVFGKLEDVEGKMTDLFASPAFVGLEKKFQEIGAKIGTWMENITPKQVEDFGNMIEGAVSIGLNLISVLGSFASTVISVASLMSKIGTPGTIAAIAGIVMLPMLIGKAIGKIGGLIGKMLLGSRQQNMVVTASQVFVNGGMGGMGGGGRQRRGYRGRRGASSRYGSRYGSGASRRELAEARLARRGGGAAVATMGMGAGAMNGAAASSLSGLGQGAATGMARGAGRRGLLGVGKSLGKKIPGLGLLLGGAFAGQRALSGDILGAGMELASGAASLVPGLGTAASFAIDAALMNRDMRGAPQGGMAMAPQAGRRRGIGMAGLVGGGVAAAGAGALAGWGLNQMGQEDNAEASDTTRNRESVSLEMKTSLENISRRSNEMKEKYEEGVAINREMLAALRRILAVQNTIAANQQ